MCTESVLVLAKSIKHRNFCVAGKNIVTGAWVRPVGGGEGTELTPEQVEYRNYYGQYSIKPLQVVQMSFSAGAPLINQPENKIVSGVIWQQCPPFNVTELAPYLDSPNDLWGAGYRVLYSSIEGGDTSIDQSLYLISVDNLNLFLNDNGKRKASFSYSGVTYQLSVTDPNFDNMLEEGKEGAAILCISLGENFEGYCYKLVAGIF